MNARTKSRPPADPEGVVLVYERNRPVAATMPYEIYARLRDTAAGAMDNPFADRPISDDPVDLAIARAGDAENAAEAVRRRRIAKAEVRAVTETVPVQVVRARAAGVHPLKAWRDARGLTQEQLAGTAGLSRAYLAQIETGAREPSLAVLRGLAAALDLLVDDLLPSTPGE